MDRIPVKDMEDKIMDNVLSREKVIVIDFGGQYNQLVARRVRECNVYCEIYSYKTDLEQIKAMNPKGIILTGGPNSCYEEGAPTYQKGLFELGVPVLERVAAILLPMCPLLPTPVTMSLPWQSKISCTARSNSSPIWGMSSKRAAASSRRHFMAMSVQ